MNHNLTANPIQAITFRTGKLALLLLVLSLACTPLNTAFGVRMALKWRRPLGLYAFMYAGLHFLTFTVLDYGLDPVLLREAIFEKRYALVGFSAFLLLVPLAITSTRGWMKRLGKRWKRLHQLVYIAGLLVIVHYVWLVKADRREPLLWGAAIAILLAFRLPPVRRAVVKLRGRALARLEATLIELVPVETLHATSLLGRASYSSHFRKIRLAFCPPNPKPFTMIVRTSAFRATFGM